MKRCRNIMDQTDEPSMQRWNKHDKTFSFWKNDKLHLYINSLVNIIFVFPWMDNRRSLDAIHGFKLAQSLHRVDMLLLRGSLDSVGLTVILFLSLHQRLLLRSFHPPGDSWHVEGLHAFVLLVLSRCNIGGLDSGHHCVHQVLCCLNKRHGAVQLSTWKRREHTKGNG